MEYPTSRLSPFNRGHTPCFITEVPHPHGHLQDLEQEGAIDDELTGGVRGMEYAPAKKGGPKLFTIFENTVF